MNLQDYELDILKEIESWETGEEDQGLLGQVSGMFAKPMDWAFSQKPSQRALESLSESIYSSLTTLYRTSERTVNKDKVLKRLEEEDIKVDSLEDLKDCDIRRLDRVAREAFSGHTLVATLQGGGTGLGGVALIAADVPLLMGINFRLIQKIGCVYGYDPKDELEVDVAMKIFQIAGSPPEERRKGILELDAAFASVRTAGQKAAMFAGTVALKHLAQMLGAQLARRKMGQLIPLVGLGIGAGVNYQFTRDIAQAAFMMSRKRFLLDKQEREEVASS